MIPKFRAWDIHAKKMFTNEQLIIWNNNVYANDRRQLNSDSLMGWSVDDKYLMQSTGLFDKNGTEIFEGDVVTFEDCDDVDTDFVYVNRGVIEYAAPTFHITNRNSTEMEDLLDGNTLDVIVLGSIYEHPHLVEGE